MIQEDGLHPTELAQPIIKAVVLKALNSSLENV
jgi:hypothetical protein